MKYIKLFEGWSDQYLYDFTDDEKFTIEENGKKVKGEYRGSFETTDMTNSFADAVSKISNDYKVLKAQAFFNQSTRNAKFEIEVQEYDAEFIEINVLTQKVKWFPEKIVNLWSPIPRDQDLQNLVCNYIYIEGRLENGTRRTLFINFPIKHEFRFHEKTLDNIEMELYFGTRTRGLSIDKENISKLIRIISENKIKNEQQHMYLADEQLQICIRTLNEFT